MYVREFNGIIVRDAFELPSRSQVAELESRLGVSLPSAYVEFLLHCNGGFFRPPNDLRVHSFDSNSNFRVVVRHIYGVGLKSNEKVFDLQWRANVLSRLERGLV